MSAVPLKPLLDLETPLPLRGGQSSISGPSHESFTARFGTSFPAPHYIESDLGRTAVYELPPPSGHSRRPVLIIHGLSTPALGMLALAKELQKVDPDAHVVLFDLWGHGLSSTPLVAHTPNIFHSQIFQVLGYMQWTRAHILGYSFGGTTAVSFALFNPWIPLSLGLLAPAGLLDNSKFSARVQELLANPAGNEREAAEVVQVALEGGDLVVAADWKQRAEKGEIVAEALREWEIQEHPGYVWSAFSMFRDGGVWGCQDNYRKLAKLPLNKIIVYAELDVFVNRGQVDGMGFDKVEVVDKFGHSFVRETPAVVASIVHRFWTQSA